ncbi:MAG: DUF3536 domain-containing protein [Thermodesulfobacteriota bacterium]|nr:DUF3536 domain-containing protein [Thermodesulfobacteriota bacterium]
MKNKRYVCLHGHFYQPPRENPWLEEVELQQSAAPYHDWNERICAECYGPNSASRILDHDHRIIDIVNNYSRISFNFGPTLLSWMERHAPEVYAAVIEADAQGAERYGGHGTALAQVYNHMIMPLADERDKRTQVLWGLADFRQRFGREPEGMWLSETAADTPTLEALAKEGIRFTILAPNQAKAVRPLNAGNDEKAWEDVTGERVDPTRPYLFRLPSGGEITLFFYDGPISKDIAFGGLLDRGENLAERLAGAFSSDREHDQLVHVATDGETYGHHRRYGDMALAYALYDVERGNGVTVTVYGQYLDLHPPYHEVRIHEASSWSCVHGVERWRSDCGCNSGMHRGWHQRWRKPLREALDLVRDNLAPLYENQAGKLLRDPWEARDRYIDVLLDRSEDNVNAFLAAHAVRELSPAERQEALQLLEMQRMAMLMYTSCGWFFDELSGIETTQVMAYAARAIQLAGLATGAELENAFKRVLAGAESNIPEFGDGADIYERLVKPGRLDLLRVGAHFAIASLFESDIENIRIYCFTQDGESHKYAEAGPLRLSMGRTRIVSGVTGEADRLTYAALYLGGHNAVCGVLPGGEGAMSGPAFAEAERAFRKGLSRGDIPELVRVLDARFPESNFTLRHLFKDEQRKVLSEIMGDVLKDMEAVFGQAVDRNYPLISFLAELRGLMPRAFQVAAEVSLGARIREALAQSPPDTVRIKGLAETVNSWGVPLERSGIGIMASERVTAYMAEVRDVLCDTENLTFVRDLIAAVKGLPVQLNLWQAQNIYFHLATAPARKDAGPGRELCDADQKWREAFAALGEIIGVKVNGPPAGGADAGAPGEGAGDA